MITAPSSALDVYLRNHEAAARAGAQLFRRAARSHRSRAWAGDLALLRDDVVQDLRSLQDLMSELGVHPDLALGAVLQVGERLGRLKPNGGLLRRMPLTDLVEIEALTDAVHAKLAGWRALVAAEMGEASQRVRLDEMVRRAENQAERLWQLHGRVAEVLRTGEVPLS